MLEGRGHHGALQNHNEISSNLFAYGYVQSRPTPLYLFDNNMGWLGLVVVCGNASYDVSSGYDLSICVLQVRKSNKSILISDGEGNVKKAKQQKKKMGSNKWEMCQVEVNGKMRYWKIIQMDSSIISQTGNRAVQVPVATIPGLFTEI